MLNIVMVDKFLGGSFLRYGTEVIKYANLDQENRSDPMIEVFPRITKCTFHKFGSSGSIQKHGELINDLKNSANANSNSLFVFRRFYVHFGTKHS